MNGCVGGDIQPGLLESVPVYGTIKFSILV